MCIVYTLKDIIFIQTENLPGSNWVMEYYICSNKGDIQNEADTTFKTARAPLFYKSCLSEYSCKQNLCELQKVPLAYIIFSLFFSFSVPSEFSA